MQKNWWKSSNGQIHYFCKGKTPLTAPSSLWKFGKYQISHFSTSERCSKKSFPHAKTKNLAIWAFSSICLYFQYYFHPIGPHCIKIFTVLGLCPLVTFARQNVRLIWNPNICSTVLIFYCVFRTSIWWNVAVSIKRHVNTFIYSKHTGVQARAPSNSGWLRIDVNGHKNLSGHKIGLFSSKKGWDWWPPLHQTFFNWL